MYAMEERIGVFMGVQDHPSLKEKWFYSKSFVLKKK
jgi:hypothetical protein